MLTEIFCQKLIVSDVILAFLDHLKPKIFYVGQPWWPTWSSTFFQNLWIRPWYNNGLQLRSCLFLLRSNSQDFLACGYSNKNEYSNSVVIVCPPYAFFLFVCFFFVFKKRLFLVFSVKLIFIIFCVIHRQTKQVARAWWHIATMLIFT